MVHCDGLKWRIHNKYIKEISRTLSTLFIHLHNFYFTNTWFQYTSNALKCIMTVHIGRNKTKIERKFVNIFLFVRFNICFGCSNWDGYFEYHNICFGWEISKNNNCTLLSKSLMIYCEILIIIVHEILLIMEIIWLFDIQNVYNIKHIWASAWQNQIKWTEYPEKTQISWAINSNTSYSSFCPYRGAKGL